jgi:hypothetical protein
MVFGRWCARDMLSGDQRAAREFCSYFQELILSKNLQLEQW